MKLKGKMVLFVETKETANGKFNTFRTSISHKEQVEGDIRYVSGNINVRFSTTNFKKEDLNKLDPAYYYNIDIKDGWLDCRAYTNNEGKSARDIYIFINEGTLTDRKKIVGQDVVVKQVNEDKKKNELPF